MQLKHLKEFTRNVFFTGLICADNIVVVVVVVVVVCRDRFELDFHQCCCLDNIFDMIVTPSYTHAN